MAPLLSRRTAAAVILSVAALPAASAFQAAAAPPLRMRAGASAACAAVSMATDSPRSSVDRRELLGVALGGAAVLLGAAPVLAKDVGDGGLPEGMMLLQQVLMFQKQWKDIGVRVADHHEEMDKTEWANIQGFLRKFYEGGDDMVKIGKGFSSNEQTEVKELAKTFRKAVKAVDKPAKAQDFEAFLVAHAEIGGFLKQFMDIRAGKSKSSPPSDIPDEL